MGAAADTLVELAAGSVGGAAGIIAGHPLDVLKVRLQTINPEHRGAFRVFFDAVRSEGAGFLLKGIVPPLVGVGAYQAVVFASYEWSLKTLTNRNIFEPQKDSIDYNIVSAGMTSGAISSIVTVPTDLVKIRLQMQTGKADRYMGAWDCANKIVRAEGILGLSRGTAATLCRDVPSTGIYFAVYQDVKRRLLSKLAVPDTPTSVPVLVANGDPSSIGSRIDTSRIIVSDSSRLVAELIAGGTAGAVAWTSCIPFDTVKTRVTIADNKYAGVLDCFRTVIREEGAGALFRGWAPLIVRAFPVNAVTFAVYESCRRWFAV